MNASNPAAIDVRLSYPTWASNSDKTSRYDLNLVINPSPSSGVLSDNEWRSLTFSARTTSTCLTGLSTTPVMAVGITWNMRHGPQFACRCIAFFTNEEQTFWLRYCEWQVIYISNSHCWRTLSTSCWSCMILSINSYLAVSISFFMVNITLIL